MRGRPPFGLDLSGVKMRSNQIQQIVGDQTSSTDRTRDSASALFIARGKTRDHLLPLYRKYGSKMDCHIELFDAVLADLPEMKKLILEWIDRDLIDKTRRHNSRIG
jgi:hypothetical protein